MIVTIISEPRCGSTNLLNWLNLNQDISVIHEPLNPQSRDYSPGFILKDFQYRIFNLVVKEIFTPEKNIDDLINSSDKTIFLFREKLDEQLESWLVASQTNLWSDKWVPNRLVHPNKKHMTDYFMNLKTQFNDRYLSSNSHFKLSYEDLYHRNKINTLIDYLKIDGLTSVNFPYGERYKQENITPNRII